MFEKVAPGQRLGTSPLRKARNVNDLADMANAFKQGKFTQPTSASGLAAPTDLVKVRNLTGAARARGEVVQLGDYLLDPVDFRNLWFEGNTVADPVSLRYAILREPSPTNEIKVAQASGVCVAKVNVTDLAHTHATPEAASHVLKSAASGPIELLMTATEAGVQDMAVRLGVYQIGFWVTLDADLLGDGVPVSATPVDFSGTVQVKGNRMLASGQKLVTGNTLYVVPVGADLQMLQSKECAVDV